MTGKQESLHDYFLMAKEIARQEKSLGIEHWDGISIDYYKERIAEDEKYVREANEYFKGLYALLDEADPVKKD